MALAHSIAGLANIAGGTLGAPIGSGTAIPAGTYIGRSAANGNVFEKYNSVPEYTSLGRHATISCIRVVKTARAFNVEIINHHAHGQGPNVHGRWYNTSGTLQALPLGDSAVIFQGAPAVYTGFRWIVDSMTNAGIQGNTIAGGVLYHPTTPGIYTEYGNTGIGFTGLNFHNSNINGFDTVSTAGDYRSVSPAVSTEVFDPAVYGYGPTTSDITSVCTISLWARAAGYQDTEICTFNIQSRIYAYLT